MSRLSALLPRAYSLPLKPTLTDRPENTGVNTGKKETTQEPRRNRAGTTRNMEHYLEILFNVIVFTLLLGVMVSIVAWYFT